MEFLRFVFSSFWTFLGTVVLLGIAFDGTTNIIKALRSRSVSPKLGLGLPVAPHLLGKEGSQ